LRIPLPFGLPVLLLFLLLLVVILLIAHCLKLFRLCHVNFVESFYYREERAFAIG
jgi:hypothetical protein